MPKRLPVLILMASLAISHPMGNSSVNHYARFEVRPDGVQVTYALDLAELPTSDLLRQWGLERNSAQPALERKVEEQARAWVRNLQFTSQGEPVPVQFIGSEFAIAGGAGSQPTLRITSHLRLTPPTGQLDYEDRNFSDRAGWKEIVIRAAGGAALSEDTPTAQDRSQALSAYPQIQTAAPPQDVRASFKWTEPGTVVKGDYLSRFLHQRELSLSMILIALAVAFVLGAAHALTPGHGKTIVAAYLVGSRGTLKHAAYLGAMVTFTHTVSVFLLGLATLFLFQYVMPQKITQALGVVSGLSIVAIGAYMLWKRYRALAHAHQHHDHHQLEQHAMAHAHAHSHSHDHDHHDHDHDHHDHDHHHHDHPHTHSHGKVVHSHAPGGHVHSHDVPDEVSWGSLSALAISGGLVPCESALVLLLSAIALGRVGLGLLLLVAFSLGLAIVLMGIGILVIYAKNLLPDRTKSAGHPAFRWIPVASAAVVMIVGLLMTGVSLGWIQTKWVV